VNGYPFRHLKLDDTLRERLAVGIHQLDQDLVRPRRQVADVHRLPARVHPVPGGIVHGHAEMPDPWRHGERGGAEHRHNLQVLGAVPNKSDPFRQQVRLRGLEDDLRRTLFRDRLATGLWLRLREWPSRYFKFWSSQEVVVQPNGCCSTVRGNVMGWEKRGKNGEFYYKPARVEGKPRKIYLGSGAVGRYHALLDRQNARKLEPIRAEQTRTRHLIREGDRLWREMWSWLWPLGEAHMLLAGWYRHCGQWRKAKRRPRTRQNRVRIVTLPDTADLRAQLKVLNTRANGAEPGAIEALRAFLDAHPETATRVEELNRESFALWTGYLGEQADPGSGSESDALPLERLLIDAIRVAEWNVRHADSLIEPSVVSKMALSTRYLRIERADNRLRDARRLLARVQKAAPVNGARESAQPGLRHPSQPETVLGGEAALRAC